MKLGKGTLEGCISRKERLSHPAYPRLSMDKRPVPVPNQFAVRAHAARTTRTCGTSHRSSVSVACFHTRVLRGLCFSRRSRADPANVCDSTSGTSASGTPAFYPVAASSIAVRPSRVSTPKGSSRDEMRSWPQRTR